ncbi:MAG: SIS domain-containing protein [Bacteroidales bacterium]|nr:SIS domain-containing protein [Bacteroidales bacterium]
MMENTFLNDLVRRYPRLSMAAGQIQKAADCLILCYGNGGKVLVCGNGGSCADSDHIVGELMKDFKLNRPLAANMKKSLIRTGGERGEYLSGKLQQGLPAISLSAHNSLLTAIANDMDANLVFAQQVAGYGNAGDLLIGISTSGKSQNVIDALIAAKAGNMSVIGLTGQNVEKMKPYCDILVSIPESDTPLVQELLMPVYHTICMITEDHFFGRDKLQP